MSQFMVYLWEGVTAAMAGAGIALLLLRWNKKRSEQLRTQQERLFLDNAHREAEAILRDARLAANEEALKIREQTEKACSARRRELAETDQRVAQREALVNRQLESLVQQENQCREKQEGLRAAQTALQSREAELQELIKERKGQLEKIAHLSSAEARTLLLKELEIEALRDAADISRHVLEQAKTKAEAEAKRLISLAIQRYAGTHTFETTTATVALQGDDIKGRIIGREGRNIRAFEAVTGVTVLIDDTPNAVVLSGFDPVRREIAREAMQRLIVDGRIHPTRIEEVVAKVKEEMDEAIRKVGEEAVYKVGLPPFHPEIIKILGSLRFRQSFSQNLLDHSIEVAHLTGLMAAELGLDVAAAKKSGLLHDIGKALNHEMEGSHALIGANFIKRYGESDEVVNGVASHHDEVPHTNLFGILVSAADAISASRPGARSETMTTYIKRLEDLEKIGYSLPGVEKCFAVQAGRELRVVVQPNVITDEQATMMARTIARKVEDELQYPGQIRVTVVRETRCVEFAK